MKHNRDPVLTFPYTEDTYCTNVYLQKESNAYDRVIPFICQSYSRLILRWWDIDVIEQEYWRFWEGELWTCGERAEPLKVEKEDKHQLTCVLIKK